MDNYKNIILWANKGYNPFPHVNLDIPLIGLGGIGYKTKFRGRMYGDGIFLDEMIKQTEGQMEDISLENKLNLLNIGVEQDLKQDPNDIKTLEEYYFYLSGLGQEYSQEEQEKISMLATNVENKIKELSGKEVEAEAEQEEAEEEVDEDIKKFISEGDAKLKELEDKLKEEEVKFDARKPNNYYRLNSEYQKAFRKFSEDIVDKLNLKQLDQKTKQKLENGLLNLSDISDIPKSLLDKLDKYKDEILLDLGSVENRRWYQYVSSKEANKEPGELSSGDIKTLIQQTGVSGGSAFEHIIQTKIKDELLKALDDDSSTIIDIGSIPKTNIDPQYAIVDMFTPKSLLEIKNYNTGNYAISVEDGKEKEKGKEAKKVDVIGVQKTKFEGGKDEKLLFVEDGDGVKLYNYWVDNTFSGKPVGWIDNKFGKDYHIIFNTLDGVYKYTVNKDTDNIVYEPLTDKGIDKEKIKQKDAFKNNFIKDKDGNYMTKDGKYIYRINDIKMPKLMTYEDGKTAKEGYGIPLNKLEKVKLKMKTEK